MANTYPADFFTLKKPRDPGMPLGAFDPGINVGNGDVPVSSAAFSPTLQPASDSARSITGGANGTAAAIAPSHEPITNPRSQSEADLMSTEQKIAAFQPKPLGFWKGAAAAYLPVLGPHFTGDYENAYNIRKADELTKIVNAQRQMEQSEAYSNYLLGRNPTSLQNTNTKAGASEDVANINAGAKTGAATIGAGAKVKAAELNLGPMADVPQELQDTLGMPAQVPLKQLNAAESAFNRPLTTVAGANDTYQLNRQTGETTALGVGSRAIGAANNRVIPVSNDPTNPGAITYMRAGDAVNNGVMSPQSAPAQTARQTARAVAPGGKVGEEINSFNTAIQHADLLKTAISALHNGDQQTLNSLRNRLNAEFGVSGPVTAQAIADAYQREITSMLSKGHMTDSEIGSVGKTLNVNSQSPKQSLDVIDAYRALAQSKMNVRQQGVQQGMRGQPNFPTGNGAGNSAGGGQAGAQQPAPGAIPEGATATGPNGHKLKFTQGRWTDAATGQPIQ